MRILITGTSKGIGRKVALRFLELGHEVYGLDRLESSINHPFYTHYVCDIKHKELLPDIEDVEILFNNAGTQNEDDLGNNLIGTINVTEKYGFNPSIKSILFNASASARSGQEFAMYVASKAAVVGYMKNVAIKLAPEGVTVNSLSLGGVYTDSNSPVIDDEESWEKIMGVTPLKKWMSEDEVADWVLFLTLTNESMSGQDILVDNGEHDLNPTFIWPK